MQKKVIVLAIIVVIVLGCGLWWFSGQGKKERLVAPVVVEKSTPTVSPKILTWNDPAGFTFQYDSSLKINNHPEDKVNYTNLEITLAGVSSKINILASDTKDKTIDIWVTKDRRSQLTGGGEKISLGGKAARKLIFPDDGRITVAVIDSEILFTIDLAPNDNGVMQKHFEQIVSSWVFWYPTKIPAQSSSGQSSGDVVEEEEIIE